MENKWKTQGSEFRWIIARILNRLFRDMCWFELAMWALLPDDSPFVDILYMRHTAGGCARNGDYNYCGKCDKAHPQAAYAEWINGKRGKNENFNSIL